MEGKQFQENTKQYKMPEALKQERDYNYQVGYESSTGNRTSGSNHPIGKTTKEE